MEKKLSVVDCGLRECLVLVATTSFGPPSPPSIHASGCWMWRTRQARADNRAALQSHGSYIAASYGHHLSDVFRDSSVWREKISILKNFLSLASLILPDIYDPYTYSYDVP